MMASAGVLVEARSDLGQALLDPRRRSRCTTGSIHPAEACRRVTAIDPMAPAVVEAHAVEFMLLGVPPDGSIRISPAGDHAVNALTLTRPPSKGDRVEP